MALESLTHRIYLSAADYESAEAGAGPGRRRMAPGSFEVLVYAVEGS